MIDTINLLYVKWEVEWWEDNFLQKLPQAVFAGNYLPMNPAAGGDFKRSTLSP
ncbi:MAG TPA: hypothetical protein VFB12_25390 [Ktedonobacteraceae bacterium]|nr:hypothetical protein [Ktedonobacteraceae bacterium]